MTYNHYNWDKSGNQYYFIGFLYKYGEKIDFSQIKNRKIVFWLLKYYIKLTEYYFLYYLYIFVSVISICCETI